MNRQRICAWRQGLPIDEKPGTAQGQGQETPAQVHWAIQSRRGAYSHLDGNIGAPA